MAYPTMSFDSFHDARGWCERDTRSEGVYDPGSECNRYQHYIRADALQRGDSSAIRPACMFSLGIMRVPMWLSKCPIDGRGTS